MVNFVEGVQAEDPNKLKREIKHKSDAHHTTLTSFKDGKSLESIIQHKKVTTAKKQDSQTNEEQKDGSPENDDASNTAIEESTLNHEENE